MGAIYVVGQWVYISAYDVLAHLIATTRLTPSRFFPALAASGFKFDRLVATRLKRELGASGADTLANLWSRVDTTSHPPGPVMAMVGEIVVHSGDIGRPLGITHAYDADALTSAADFYKSSNLLIGAKTRIAGLTLRATDVDWSTGSGPEVSGPLIALVLAMCGRSATSGDLSGEGAATLASRL
ncbi:MAG: maleylpyruvate isomerase family mycothiol-dependent enzyme [Acidimicrobiales bacterium]